MTRDEFIAALNISECSRVGRKVRSRTVVHARQGNSSFKAYFLGDRWIVETWQPAAFLFGTSEVEVTRVTEELLKRPMHSQAAYIQQTFPWAVKLFSCSLLKFKESLSEVQIIARFKCAAERICLDSEGDCGVSYSLIPGSAYKSMNFS